MKRKIFLLLGIFFLLYGVSDVFALEVGINGKCEDPTDRYEFEDPINNSCHYECVDTAKMIVLGPQEGLAGMGIQYPFQVIVTTDCIKIDHPEPYPPYPPDRWIITTVCETQCHTCSSGDSDGGGDTDKEGSVEEERDSENPETPENPDDIGYQSYKPEPCVKCYNPDTGGPMEDFCEANPKLCGKQMSSLLVNPNASFLLNSKQDYHLQQVGKKVGNVYENKGGGSSGSGSGSGSNSDKSEKKQCCRRVCHQESQNIGPDPAKVAAWHAEVDRINADLSECNSLPQDYTSTVIEDDVNKVQMEITEKQGNKKLGHLYSFGQLEFIDNTYFDVPMNYVQLGTGNVPSTIPSLLEDYYKGGRYYYTDFFTQRSDGPHPIYVDAIKLGTYENMSLHAECYYNLENKYFNTDTDPDDPTVPSKPGDSGIRGGIQYIFRPISLDDVFPISVDYPQGRAPRWNWSSGATSMLDQYYPINPTKLTLDIEQKGYSIYTTSNNNTDPSSELEYEIKLTPEVMRRVRQYNKNQGNYLNYDDYCYKDHNRSVCGSKFLKEILPGYGAQVTSHAIIGCNNQSGTTCDYSYTIRE